MRLSDIIRMGKDYMLLGIVVVILVAVIYLVGYFLIYRKLLKGTKKPRNWKLLLGAIFLIYLIVVVGATMLGRFGYMGRNINALLSSYRYAWYNFDQTEWRNLILNICMFVPFGFFLPILFEKMRKIWRTYLTGFLFSVAIEGAQLALRRGIFECDDILNNFVGTMIGYGIAYLVLSVVFSGLKVESKERHRNFGKKSFLLTVQIPLLCTVLFFCSVFLVYEKQEFGNMVIDNHMHFQNLTVSGDMELSDEAKEAEVYHLRKYEAEETLAFANAFFTNLGTTVNEDRTDPYQNTIVYWSEDGEHDLWVEYDGLAYRYTDFSELEAQAKIGVSRNEIEDALGKFDIQIPESATFSEDENGYYRFSIDMERDGEILKNGELQCRYTEDGTLEHIDQNILSYEKYRSDSIISEREAYEKIVAGDFYYDSDCSGEEIHLNSVSLTYEKDSKGFYRPVYCFAGKIGNETGQIMISAIDK